MYGIIIEDNARTRNRSKTLSGSEKRTGYNRRRFLLWISSLYPPFPAKKYVTIFCALAMFPRSR